MYGMYGMYGMYPTGMMCGNMYNMAGMYAPGVNTHQQLKMKYYPILFRKKWNTK